MNRKGYLITGYYSALQIKYIQISIFTTAYKYTEKWHMMRDARISKYIVNKKP